MILGVMADSKTTMLQEIARTYRHIGKKVMMVNTVCDIRCGDGLIKTHYDATMEAFKVKNLAEIKAIKDYNSADIICIDEGNFYSDLPEICRYK